MHKRPLLSVVVPVYNVERYLDRCISSIVKQGYDNLEIILVDDGSIDRSSEICDEWVHKDKRIIAVHKENGGIVSARKEGIRIASGDYITQVDSDDWIEENAYAYMMEILLSENVDLIAYGVIKDYANHSVIDINNVPAGCYRGEQYIKEILGTLLGTNTFYKHGLSGRIVDKICKMDIAKEAQIKVPDSINMNEDLAMMMRLLCRAKSIMIIEDVFYHYCVRDNSVCDLSRNDLRAAGDYKKYMQEIAKEFSFVPRIQKQTVMAVAYNKAFTNTEAFIRIIDNELYPYRAVYVGQKVLVYGAGKFGRRLYEILVRCKKFTIVGWTDKTNFKGSIPIDEAIKLEYDVVIIAIAMADVAENAVNGLIKLGVEPNKIRRISADWIMSEENDR